MPSALDLFYGRDGKSSQSGGGDALDLFYGNQKKDDTDINVNLTEKDIKEPDENDVGVIESVLSGVVSGLIKIPEGVVSLGASLYDLGADTNTAAKVEKFFDDINPFDEAAEATAAGKIVETLVNLGVPGGIAFTKGASLANKALQSRKLGTYFTLKNPALKKAGEQAAQLNAKGKVAKYAAASLGAGAAEGIFVGDVEKVGTFGDLLGGPTKLQRTSSDEEYDPGREVLNRIKFGTEGAVFSGVIGGVGTAIKKIATRGKELARSNSKIDQILDSVASKFRGRGKKDEEFFRAERVIKGLRSADLNLAQQISRELDKNIDAIFPNLKSVYNSTVGNKRKEALKKLNDLLLSGNPVLSGEGKTFKTTFNKITYEQAKFLTEYGANPKNIEAIVEQLNQIRGGWGNMFTALGAKMPKNSLASFKNNFADKFQGYLDSTFEIFENKNVIPFTSYKPTRQLVEKTMKEFQRIARQNGERLTDEEAEYYVNEVLRTAKIPKGLPFGAKKAPEVVFALPKEIVKDSFVDNIDKVSAQGFTSLRNIKKDQRQVIEELLGKVENPISTILGGTERLSMLTRQNQFFQQLRDVSERLIAEGKPGLFYKASERGKAVEAFGVDNVKIVEFLDPGRKYDAGIPNPVSGMFTSKGMADALTQVEKGILNNDNLIGYTLNNFILLPKATSQIAKTILSPITHLRNFFSAGAFAVANGIIPTPAAMKTAYSALQIPVKGARKSIKELDKAGSLQGNDLYRRLLELGVVNSNVRLGDLRKLIGDITFLDDTNLSKYVGGIFKKLKQGQKGLEDFYTAEDDFWKISTWAVERDRLGKAYAKAGIKKTTEELEEEAASIVRNNVPNYDQVSDFIKELRKFPLGNFVSFPAEIMRTGTNIVRRAVKEIQDPALRSIGFQRLLGFGFVTSAVPFGIQQGAKAIQNISDEDMEALRRYVPEWSKNSTLIPIRDEKTNKLKYVDFSHGNAYDTLIRPIQTVINNVSAGRTDEDGIMDDFMMGLAEATKELAAPFISESIWTEAFMDILARKGRTRDGRVLYTEETPYGERVSIIFKHLVKSQAPGSLAAFKRTGLAITGETDDFGRSFELGDELAGYVGFRAVEVDPTRAINFKIADFQDGIRNSRKIFTTPLLRGGEISPADIVDRFIVANQQAYKVKKEMFKDYFAALRLGGNFEEISDIFDRRGVSTELEQIQQGIFKPLTVSDGIKEAFERNARNLGVPNPFTAVEPFIDNMIDFFSNMPLELDSLPTFPNPFMDIELSSKDTSFLPPSGDPIVGPSSNLATTQNIQQKGQQVFGTNDSVFGG